MWWFVLSFFFFLIEIKCSASGIQWMDHFEYPALLLLMLALNRLSPTDSAADCLALLWMLVLLAFSGPEVSSHKLRQKVY